ncbi:MAG: lytic transglycosylase domain-containing protein [Blastocatellia bacterium]
MSRKHGFWFLPLVCVALCAGLARADELWLRDGRVIQADQAWEMGDTIWYRRGGALSSLPREQVAKIISAGAVAHAAGKTGKTTTTPDGRPVEVRNTSARILLKNGPEFVVDEAHEFPGYIRYRMGAMSTVVDREAVDRISRENIAPAATAAPPRTLPYTTGHAGLDQLIASASARHQVDATLIYLVMRQESSFNQRAVSRVGARGLMQLMPASARRFGVSNVHDPAQNIDGGVRYLKFLLDLYQRDLNLTLAAYNAGEHAVARYNGRVPPYRETRNYVHRINTAYRRAMSIAASPAGPGDQAYDNNDHP